MPLFVVDNFSIFNEVKSTGEKELALAEYRQSLQLNGRQDNLNLEVCELDNSINAESLTIQEDFLVRANSAPTSTFVFKTSKLPAVSQPPGDQSQPFRRPYSISIELILDTKTGQLRLTFQQTDASEPLLNLVLPKNDIFKAKNKTPNVVCWIWTESTTSGKTENYIASFANVAIAANFLEKTTSLQKLMVDNKIPLEKIDQTVSVATETPATKPLSEMLTMSLIKSLLTSNSICNYIEKNVSYNEVKKKLEQGQLIIAHKHTDDENYDILMLSQSTVNINREEDNEVLFCARAKLFRFAGNQWEERGVGNVKLLKNNEGKVRLLIRRDQVLKICANHNLTPDMELTAMSNNDKAWIWAANDYADEKIKLEKFCIQFKLVEEAQAFKEHFDKAKKSVPVVGTL